MTDERKEVVTIFALALVVCVGMLSLIVDHYIKASSVKPSCECLDSKK